MLFTELVFIPFLMITFFLFSFARKSPRFQLMVLLGASFVFYAWWDVRFLGLIVASSLFNYALAGFIHKAAIKSRKKTLLLIGLFVHLGVLGFFKYADFFIESFIALLNAFGLHVEGTVLNIMVPLGISFYTFWTVSYLVDVYRGTTEPARSVPDYLLFAACFPHVIAGPIVRAREYLSRLGGNLYEKSDPEGIFLILYGAAKKVLLADTLGRLFVDPVFQGTLAKHGSLEVVFVLYCYAFQLFFDFSAYSDIAIGLGKIFGLRYPVNFKHPYSASSPPEFWRRWHITLSNWLRDYLFLPIAYAVMRKTSAPTWLNVKIERWGYVIGMMTTMLLCGLWHGADWTFVLWGGLHGLYLVGYNLLPRKWKKRKTTPRFLRVFLFFNLIALAWVFFRSPSVEYAFAYLGRIVRFSPGFDHFPVFVAGLLLAVSLAVHYLVEPHLDKIAGAFGRLPWPAHALIVFALLVFLAYRGEQNVAAQAFIYFRF